MFVGLVLAERYELIEKLGAGGMGSVWRARDRTLNAEVAVKLMGPQFAESTEAVARFRREAQAAAAIRSTYVVQILDHGIDGGTPFIAMELLKGESLAQRLRREQTLSPELTGRFLGQVARALALSHSHGIVHRDMKPDNIFLVRDDEEVLAKVLDFGVARQTLGLAESTGLKTSTGAIMGTPFYMSPEQATGQPADHLTDIWSFGVIACECLTGRRPFSSQTLGGLFHAICMATLPIPSQLNSVPPEFDAWFARAIARDKAERFQSIKAAADQLRAVCGREPGRPSVASASMQLSHDTIASAASTVPMTSLPATGATAPQALQTAAPSTHSIPNLTRPKRKLVNVLGWVVAALVVGLLLIGWRWLNRPTPPASAVAVGATLANPASQPASQASLSAVSTQPLTLPAPVDRPHTAVVAGPSTAQAARNKLPLPRLGASTNPERSPANPMPSSNPRRQLKEGPIADDNVAGI